MRSAIASTVLRSLRASSATCNGGRSMAGVRAFSSDSEDARITATLFPGDGERPREPPVSGCQG